MKKRLIGTLLMGALFVSSTSVFVSCKDYDDDINNIVATKADKTALEEAKQTLQNEINGLKTQLETVNGQITALDKQKADKFTEDGKEYNLKDVWTNLNAKASALEASIALSNKAIDEINALLGGKLEGDLAGKTYKQALQETWATAAAASAQAAKNLEAITALKNALEDPETGLQAVWKDLEGQKDALDKLAARVKAVEDDYLKAADKEYLLTQISNLETKLTTAIETAKNAAIAAAAEDATDKANKAKEAAIAAAATDATNKANDAKQQAIEAAAVDAKNKANAAQAAAVYAASVYTDEQIAALNIDSLKTAVKGLSDRVDVIQPLVNNLNVYVRQALRGLVFDMKSFYAGIEATDVTVLWYKKYTLNGTNADSCEAFGYTAPQGTNWTNREHAAIIGEPVVIAPGQGQLIPRIDDIDDADYGYYWSRNELKANRAAHEYKDKTTLDRRYSYKEESRVLEFVAEYFMNPSSAVIPSDSGYVKVVAADKAYHSGLDNNGRTPVAMWDAEFNGQDFDYEAGIAVKDWKVKDGKLIVNFDCTNPNAIRSIQNDKAVTIFATQVKDKDNNDSTITSDFAALYKQEVRDLVISHTPSTAKAGLHNGVFYGTHAADSVNTHCGQCYYTGGTNEENLEYAAGLHLMQTVSEAAGTLGGKFKPSAFGGFSCQDSVAWNDSLNLEKLVEVHYTAYDANAEGSHKKMSSKEMTEKYGLHFEFELTGLYYGNNETSESAHAAIKHDGDSIWWFRPQMPTRDGKAAAWDNGGVANGKVGKQDRQTIGRTPLVRVKLVDSEGNVVDYGYIRIRVFEWATEPVVTVESVNYDTDAMEATKNFCVDLEGKGFEFTQLWQDMEWDIHHEFGLSHDEFEDEYEIDGSGDVFNQYYYNKDTKKLERVTEGVAVTADNKNKNKSIKLGEIKKKTEASLETTSVIWWKVGAAELAAYADTNRLANPAVNAGDVQRWVNFKKKANSTLAYGPDRIWVSLTPQAFTITTEPAVSGTINWAGRKNPNYWYDINVYTGIRTGDKEVHANVLDVEKMTEKCDTLDKLVPAVFNGNIIAKLNDETDMAKFITLNDKASVKAKDLKLRLEFVKGDSIFNGVWTNGKTYQIITRPAVKKGDNATQNGYRALVAYIDVDKNGKFNADKDNIKLNGDLYVDTVATLEYTDNSKKDINHMKVKYHETNIAKSLLNFRAHSDLQDDLLTAFVNVTAKYLTCDVPLAGDPIRVRFLRPINVEGKAAKVQDAGDGVQRVNMLDLVNLTDWRDMPFASPFYYFYDIKAINIVGVGNNANVASNEDVMTNLSAETGEETSALDKQLSKVSNMVRLIYHAPASPVTLVKGEKPDADAYGYLEYQNLGSTVQQFKVKIPVKVTYYWGDVYTNIVVTILTTEANARAAK